MVDIYHLYSFPIIQSVPILSFIVAVLCISADDTELSCTLPPRISENYIRKSLPEDSLNGTETRFDIEYFQVSNDDLPQKSLFCSCSIHERKCLFPAGNTIIGVGFTFVLFYVLLLINKCNNMNNM